MSRVSPEEMFKVLTVTDEQDVSRVNHFFNSRMIKEELHRFTYRTTLNRAFERDDRRLFYVEDEGDLVGALMVWCESQVLESDEAQIRLVAVHPEYRNHGMARSLCIKAEGFATEYGEKMISADVAQDSPAVDFWKSCGYEEAYGWETDNGREMYRIEKSLA